MSRQRERGVVLIAALWTVMLLAIIAGSLIQVARGERQIGRNVLAAAQARALADAGIVYAIAGLLARDPEDTWLLDGTPRVVTIAGARVVLSVQDELGKIDLNAAPEDTLKRLFMSLGVEERRAEVIAEAIADWRDADDLKRAHGAERDDYRAAGRSADPRDGPFESIDEFEQVLGVTRAIAESARPALTVYSRRPFVDPTTAPPEVQHALPELNDRKAANILRARGVNAPSHANGANAALADLLGRAVTITARANTDTEADDTRVAVVRFTGHPQEPYMVHAWH